MTSHTPFRIAPATEADVPLLLDMIRELAAYERLADQVVATESGLREALFRVSASVEAVIARGEGEPLGFALFFHNFSTFLGRRGLYLEDLYVRPEARGDGVGRTLLTHLAGIARARGCGRMEWAVLDWNRDAIRFYRGLGAHPLDGWTTFRLTGDALDRLAGEDGDSDR